MVFCWVCFPSFLFFVWCFGSLFGSFWFFGCSFVHFVDILCGVFLCDAPLLLESFEPSSIIIEKKLIIIIIIIIILGVCGN